VRGGEDVGKSKERISGGGGGVRRWKRGGEGEVGEGWGGGRDRRGRRGEEGERERRWWHPFKKKTVPQGAFGGTRGKNGGGGRRRSKLRKGARGGREDWTAMWFELRQSAARHAQKREKSRHRKNISPGDGGMGKLRCFSKRKPKRGKRGRPAGTPEQLGKGMSDERLRGMSHAEKKRGGEVPSREKKNE